MKILALDDEKTALYRLSKAIREAVPDCELRDFSLVSEALTAVRSEGFMPHVAFLDIEMPQTNGLEVAARLKLLQPEINIVFVTGYSHYAINAMALRPSGYVTKPASMENILNELQHLRNPPDSTKPPKRVRVQCFGNFGVFLDGHPLHLGRSKSLELLAFLVDRRGVQCPAAAIADALWEDGIYDRTRQQQLSKFRLDLIHSLEEAGIADMISTSRAGMAVNPEAFDCDYYDALAGDTVAINSFMGEYMQPYLWAMYTEAELVNKFNIIE